tara:strand:+ start:6248 stop:7654 length:1407 start_codon:yes stop_codon:yes gene_type:complete
MSEFKLLINGELRDGSSSFEVVNPATEEVVALCPAASEEQLDEAVAAARTAFVSWAATDISIRQAKLIEISEAIGAHAEKISNLLVQEQGKSLAQAQGEVGFAQAWCQHFSTQELPVEVLLDNKDQRIEIHHKPLGVVAGIMPWNFPFLISVYKLAPAIVVGNVIILKPAPSTPLTSLLLGELIKDILPPGVVQILSDENTLGPAITSHPGIAKISFTGSTPTGKVIMAAAAGTLKRLTLELGGNDAAIVLDDVNPKEVAEGIFGAAFLNSGQVCIAIKRLYVHESIYDEMCDEIAKLANASVVGNGLDEATQFGPVQNKAQFKKVRDYVEDARVNGNIIAGGDISDAPGFFVPLTVVRDIEDGTRVVDEEPFGPVLPIIKYSDLDDAVARANSSIYGLGGSVWSSDPDRGARVAQRLEAGTVWVNQHCAFGPHIPFPPAKQSGIGVEWGKQGLAELTAMQVVNINKA